jgi:hypothetical protein
LSSNAYAVSLSGVWEWIFFKGLLSSKDPPLPVPRRARAVWNRFKTGPELTNGWEK